MARGYGRRHLHFSSLLFAVEWQSGAAARGPHDWPVLPDLHLLVDLVGRSHPLSVVPSSHRVAPVNHGPASDMWTRTLKTGSCPVCGFDPSEADAASKSNWLGRELPAAAVRRSRLANRRYNPRSRAPLPLRRRNGLLSNSVCSRRRPVRS